MIAEITFKLEVVDEADAWQELEILNYRFALIPHKIVAVSLYDNDGSFIKELDFTLPTEK